MRSTKNPCRESKKTLARLHKELFPYTSTKSMTSNQSLEQPFMNEVVPSMTTYGISQKSNKVLF